MIELELYTPKVYSVKNFITGKRYIFCGNVTNLRPTLNKLSRGETITTKEHKLLFDVLDYNFPKTLDANTNLVFAVISPFDSFEMIKKIITMIEGTGKVSNLVLLESKRKGLKILGHDWIRNSEKLMLPNNLDRFDDSKRPNDVIRDNNFMLLKIT